MESWILQEAKDVVLWQKKMAFLFIKIRMQINNQQLQWGLWNFCIYKEAKIFINIEIGYFLATYLYFLLYFFFFFKKSNNIC